MRRRLFRGCWVLAGLLCCAPLMGQEAFERISTPEVRRPAKHLGYPHDWSSRHVLMPGVSADEALVAAERDPRHAYNLVMRQVVVGRSHFPMRQHRLHPKIDWAVSLENGYVPQNQFPAKYQFDVSTEDCNSEYVVFGLTVTKGTQANLVGINNLYT